MLSRRLAGVIAVCLSVVPVWQKKGTGNFLFWPILALTGKRVSSAGLIFRLVSSTDGTPRVYTLSIRQGAGVGNYRVSGAE